MLFFFAARSQSSNKNLLYLYQHKQFETLNNKNTNKNNPNYYFYKAVYANVTNQCKRSNAYLDSFLRKGPINKIIPFDYWNIRNDNYVKLGNYQQAFITNQKMNRDFKVHLKDGLDDSRQTEKIWHTLIGTPTQITPAQIRDSIPIVYDVAKLINISVRCNNMDTNFVFDTGAGISSITESMAKKLGLHILPSDEIHVSGFSGVSNKVKIAVADSLQFGGIKVYHPYFLVFNDSAFSFGNGAYKINGIIGFPVIKDLGTITIDSSQIVFVKGFKNTVAYIKKNLFIESLHAILMLRFNGMELPFSFDTGADKTSFSKVFFEQFAKILKLDSLQLNTSKIGSAGGERMYKSYTLKQLDFKLSNQAIQFKDAEIDTENYNVTDKYLFGNIGQDLLKQYKKRVISFDDNYLLLQD